MLHLQVMYMCCPALLLLVCTATGGKHSTPTQPPAPIASLHTAASQHVLHAGEEDQDEEQGRWQPSSPLSGTASHGPRQSNQAASQAAGGYEHATGHSNASKRDHKGHRRRSRGEGEGQGMVMGVVDPQLEGRKGNRRHQHHRHKPSNLQ